MKTIYLMIILVVILGACKYSNEEDFTIKQNYDFELEDSRNGKEEIKNSQKHLILYSDEEEIIPIHENLKKYFEFSKIKYDEKGFLEDIGELKEYSSVIFIGKTYSGINKKLFTEVLDFANKGGNLIFLSIPYFSPFNTYMGIEEKGDYINSSGLYFKKSFFPGLDDIANIDTIIKGASLEVVLSEDVEVIATGDKGNPLIWETNIGNGSILSVNTTIIDSKMTRGLLAQIISYGNDYFIMPILNSKVVHIDAFPAPIPSETNKKIYEDYGVKTKEFFKKIWWEDVRELALKCNLKITGNMIAEYTEITNKEKMKDIYQINAKDLKFFGSKLFESEGELGAHGYSQNPLFLEEDIDLNKYTYYPWKDKDSMEYSVQKLLGVIGDVYGTDIKIHTYTPPSNLLSLKGKKVLVDNLPNLKTLSGIYTDSKGYGILSQEIGRDPEYPNIYSMPRFSSGFIYSKEEMWRVYNGIAAYGLISHYINPYEALIVEDGKENHTWTNVMQGFKKIFIEVEKGFPTLEGQVQSEVTKKYIALEQIEILHEMNNNNININIENYRGEVNTFIRMRGREIKGITGGEYILIDNSPDYNLYLVKLQDEDVNILLGGA